METKPGMGSSHSTEKGNLRSRSVVKKSSLESIDGHLPLQLQEMERAPARIDESRFIELVHALQRIARLQKEATNASVHARQKKREVSFKRQDVWMSDAKFMGEIQRLVAQGKLEGFEDLLRLATGCQITRDGLGPLEQEGIEAEQQWEGHVWKLQQAEEELYSEFGDEFEVAGSFSAPSASASSSQSEGGSEPDAHNDESEISIDQADGYPPTRSTASSSIFQFDPDIEHMTNQQGPASSVLLDLVVSEPFPLPSDKADSDSGIGDIDESICQWVRGDFIELPPPAHKSHHSSIELYPQLLTDFVSRRNRINKWLENTVLLSHIEGTSLFTILKDQLECENKLVPSNWSQLVMAYWELDGAATPHSHKPTNPQSNKTPDKLLDVSATVSPKDSHLTPIPIDLQSPKSSNAGLGHFSDNPSNCREGFLPLRPPPPPPGKPHAKYFEGKDGKREEKQPP